MVRESLKAQRERAIADIDKCVDEIGCMDFNAVRATLRELQRAAMEAVLHYIHGTEVDFTWVSLTDILLDEDTQP